MAEVKVIESEVIRRHCFKYFEVADGWVEVALHWTAKHGQQEVISRKKKRLYVWKLTIKQASQDGDGKLIKAEKPVTYQGFATKYEIQMAKKEGFPPRFYDSRNSPFVALSAKTVERIKEGRQRPIVTKWGFRKLRSSRPFDDLKAGRAKLYRVQSSNGKIRTSDGKEIGRIW